MNISVPLATSLRRSLHVLFESVVSACLDGGFASGRRRGWTVTSLSGGCISARRIGWADTSLFMRQVFERLQLWHIWRPFCVLCQLEEVSILRRWSGGYHGDLHSLSSASAHVGSIGFTLTRHHYVVEADDGWYRLGCRGRGRRSSIWSPRPQRCCGWWASYKGSCKRRRQCRPARQRRNHGCRSANRPVRL